MSAPGVRQRSVATANTVSENGRTTRHSDVLKSASKRTHLLREPVWCLLFAFNGLLYLFIHFRHVTFPDPVTIRNAKPNQFVEERARNYLLNITALGDRPVGSVENEQLVVNYLVKELIKIKENTNPAHRFELNIQRNLSGTFALEFLGEFTSYYENLQNIIVKLSPKGGADHSLLVNCHYDTVLDSPGKFRPALHGHYINRSRPSVDRVGAREHSLLLSASPPEWHLFRFQILKC